MFPAKYFCHRYFARRFWAPGFGWRLAGAVKRWFPGLARHRHR
jgi:hypothetical protein